MDSQQEPTLMRSLAIESYCKPEAYQILKLPVPSCTKPDHVLIKVHAASINPVDVKVAAGSVKSISPKT